LNSEIEYYERPHGSTGEARKYVIRKGQMFFTDVEGSGSTIIDHDYAATQVRVQLGEEISICIRGVGLGHQDIYVVRRPVV
jgi:hypothetical protein